MESCDETENSLPFIDDTDDETNPNYYNLKIIENYQNKNRNIEISNQYPDDAITKSLSPVAPLAEETECDISDSRISDEEEKCKHLKRLPKQPGMKLVIKGCNSTISIQGLDDKSSITFKRKSGRVHPKVIEEQKDKTSFYKMEKPIEKGKKGRWKMLTRSLISKSARFDRRGLDERYPKYVLLKNEEEISQENYPKMVLINDKKQKENKNMETKTEFNFKKSFNNKTKPIIPMEEILAKPKTVDKKKPLSNRSLSENRNVAKKTAGERRKSIAVGRPPPEISPPHVFNEIQGIIEDTLNMYPETKMPEQPPAYPENLMPPHLCQFCRDPCCCSSPHNQPPMYIPVYPPYSKPRHQYKHSNTQTSEGEFRQGDTLEKKPETDFQDLPFGILSSFFPRVVIMKTFQNNMPEDSVNEERPDFQQPDDTKTSQKMETEFKPPTTLEVPQRNLTLKSSIIPAEVKPDPEPVPSFFSGDFYVNCLAVNDVSSLDDDRKTKADDSEATEYLHFCETEPPENESVKPQTFANKKDSQESAPDLTLTKIGYKMYDNLTKLSLNREKEPEIQEIQGCGCNGNATKNLPYNIILESNNRILKVTVPENQLNFQILNSNGGDIQIGVSAAEKNLEEKKIVRKTELWHPDNGRKDLVVVKDESKMENQPKGSQKIKLSMGESKDVVLSIEMDEKDKEEEKPLKKSTKEIKIGTDDFDVAGGDFQYSFGGYKNLSPRTGQLLKNLQQKLELGEKEKKFLTEKINEKLTDQKFQAGILPGIFFVKQISPRATPPKKPLKVAEKKPKKVSEGPDTVAQLREYYCEDCLATMRIFEDEIPSVKNMVNKFETIIQLESY